MRARGKLLRAEQLVASCGLVVTSMLRDKDIDTLVDMNTETVKTWRHTYIYIDIHTDMDIDTDIDIDTDLYRYQCRHRSNQNRNETPQAPSQRSFGF